jgi:hypothetical protein
MKYYVIVKFKFVTDSKFKELIAKNSNYEKQIKMNLT